MASRRLACGACFSGAWTNLPEAAGPGEGRAHPARWGGPLCIFGGFSSPELFLACPGRAVGEAAGPTRPLSSSSFLFLPPLLPAALLPTPPHRAPPRRPAVSSFQLQCPPHSLQLSAVLCLWAVGGGEQGCPPRAPLPSRPPQPAGAGRTGERGLSSREPRGKV